MTAISAPIPMDDRPIKYGDFVDRLSQPSTATAAGPFVAIFQILISFGLLPLILWPTRWAGFVESERRDLMNLASWWQRRVDAKEAAKLKSIAKGLRRRPLLMVLPWLAAGFNVVTIATVFAQGDDLARIWDLLFKHGQPGVVPPGEMVTFFLPRFRAVSIPFETHVYPIWMTTLCFAYGCHWYAVRSYAVTVHSLAHWTNKIAREHNLVQVRNDALKIGLELLWIVLAIALCITHVWWAIPMVFAGAMQRRYTIQSSPEIRIAFAEQTREAFAITHSGPDRFCKADHCGAVLPTPARFCPRCGTAA